MMRASDARLTSLRADAARSNVPLVCPHGAAARDAADSSQYL